MPDLYSFFAAVRDLLVPASCPACNKETDRRGICESCFAVLDTAQLSDGRGELLNEGQTILCRSVFSYGYDRVRTIVKYLKQNPDRAVCRYLASYLAREVRSFGLEGDTIITYVPRSSEGMRENGFDQSRMLAKTLAGFVPETTFACLIKRKGKSKAQKLLSAEDRKENVKGKFRALKTDASPKNIIITDDVFTTGSSVKECASVLHKAYPGAVIYCVTVAKNL